MCRVAVASASVAASSAVAPGESVGCGSGACRPVLLAARSSAPSASRTCCASVSRAAALCAISASYSCLTLRELGGSPRQLGRLPPLRFLQRRLCVGQLLREAVAVGDFLREPDFEPRPGAATLRAAACCSARRAVRRAASAASASASWSSSVLPGRGRSLRASVATPRRARVSRSAAAAALAAQSCMGPFDVPLRPRATAARACRGPQHSAPPRRRTVLDAAASWAAAVVIWDACRRSASSAPSVRRPAAARGCRGWRLPARAGLRLHSGAATACAAASCSTEARCSACCSAVSASASRSSSVCRVAVASASVAASSASRRVNPLGRGSGACRPVLLGLFERPFGFAHLLRERVAGRGTLRHLSVSYWLDARRAGRQPSSSGTPAAAPLPSAPPARRPGSARGCRGWRVPGRSLPERSSCPREGALPRC